MKKLYSMIQEATLASFLMQGIVLAVPLHIQSLPNTHIFDIEIAQTSQERAQGLMYRQTIADNQGILFLFPHLKKQCFWMKNTLMPLDILMIDDNGEIVEILYDMKPQSKQCRCSNKPVSRAIELKAGICHDRGIRPGDKITLNP